MERRKALKSIGQLGILGLTAGTFLSSCKEDKKQEKIIQIKKETPVETKNRQLMKIKDSANPTKAELKHTPEIILGDKDEKGFTLINITVGSKGIIHPTKKDHWIDFVKLYKDDQLVGQLNIESGMARGFAGFKVNLENAKYLKAIIGCNIHGVWENSLQIAG